MNSSSNMKSGGLYKNTLEKKYFDQNKNNAPRVYQLISVKLKSLITTKLLTEMKSQQHVSVTAKVCCMNIMKTRFQ